MAGPACLRDGPAMGLLACLDTGAWMLEDRVLAAGPASLRLRPVGTVASGLSSGVGDLENSGTGPWYALTTLHSSHQQAGSSVAWSSCWWTHPGGGL